jgi:hypothetical protein
MPGGTAFSMNNKARCAASLSATALFNLDHAKFDSLAIVQAR